nr:uncharacterized protein LOC122270499 [Parasteatoda tepidariorum]
MGSILQSCQLIKWDDCAMARRKALKALHHTLRDLRENETAIGSWGNSLRKKINIRILRRTQRRILLRIIRGYRTVSYDAVFVIAGLPPIDLIILNNLELKEKIKDNDCLTLDGKLPISCLPHPACRKPVIIIPYVNNVFQEYKTICFTDGSKLDGRVGLAFVIYENGTENVTAKHRLHNECTVFQAELLCINLVVKWIQNSFSENQIFKYLICTDSLSSLFLLRDTTSTEKLVVEIHSILNALENVTIHFSYVRGHSGILGNERADQLAREATCGEIDLRVSVPASHWKRIARDKIIADWNAEFLASPRSLWTKRFFPSIFHRLQFCMRVPE